MTGPEAAQDWLVEDAPDEMAPPSDWTVEEAPKERGFLASAARVGTQYVLGRLQGTVPGMAYDIATIPVGSEAKQRLDQSMRIAEDMEYLEENNAGKPFAEWPEKDKELHTYLQDQLRGEGEFKERPRAGAAGNLKDVVAPTDISIRGIAEGAAKEAFGINLHPEGILEKAANWMGFVKDPTKIKELTKIGLKPVELFKAIAPTTTKASLRGVGAGTALQMAEEGQFGPVGTIGAAIVGDILLGQGPRAITKAIMNPKQTLAEATNLLTMNNTRRLAANQLAEDFAASNLKIDAGSLTGSPLVQMVQARLSQSGLMGTALDNFRKELSSQIVKEYENVLADLGEIKFENNYQASEAIKNALKVEEQSLNINKEPLKEQAKRARSLEGRITTETPTDYRQNFLDTIAPERLESTYQKGENLKTAAEDVKRPFKEQFEERFTDFNRKTQNIPAQPQPQLAREMNAFIRDHQGSLLLGESAAEARVVQAAIDLREALNVSEGAGRLRNVRLDQLIKTKRTLNDVANYEFGGSDFESAYKKLVGDVDAAIDRTLANHEALRNEFLHLNADYSGFKTLFEDKNLKHLFEPKNHNYNSIYKEFTSSPDKLRSLEDAMQSSERGMELVNQIKRDYAQEVINRPNITAQDLQDLQSVLGPEHAQEILDFSIARQQALEHPLPRPATHIKKSTKELGPLGVNAPAPQIKPSINVEGRKISESGVERSRQGMRKKMAESMKNKDGSPKSPDQIMAQMNTVQGIRKLKEVLNTTPDGKELFKELSRYKLADIIDSKMTDAVTQDVKLKTFGGLLAPAETRAVVKELVGEQAFQKLQLLQRNAGTLGVTAQKFFNASGSGVAVIDAAMMGSAMTALYSGNPFAMAAAIASIGGSYGMAKLLADPIYLNYLERAIKTNNPRKFMTLLEKMQPIVEKAIQKEVGDNASREESKERT